MPEKDPVQRLRRLSGLIGDTPLLAIEFMFRDKKRKIYAKAESFNLTGSIKDRMSYTIMEKAYIRGTLKEGYSIIEVSSGNTGISFAALGQALGHRVTIFMPDWVSCERRKLLEAFGAEIILFSKGEGGFPDYIGRAEELSRSTENSFIPAQFSNDDNTEAHYTATGPEIWHQLRSRTIFPDAFVAGVGTGGTIMGTGRFLKECNPAIRLHPLQPAGSPFLSVENKEGGHRIEGIADGYIPPILDLQDLDSIISVDDGDAILMARKLAAELGLGVGISSGANFLGALEVQERMGNNAAVVTLFPDDNKKYLSTDLFRKEPLQDWFLSPHVTLLGVESYAGSYCKSHLPQK